MNWYVDSLVPKVMALGWPTQYLEVRSKEVVWFRWRPEGGTPMVGLAPLWEEITSPSSEDTARREPSASQEESPTRHQTLQQLDLDLPSLQSYEK